MARRGVAWRGVSLDFFFGFSGFGFGFGFRGVEGGRGGLDGAGWEEERDREGGGGKREGLTGLLFSGRAGEAGRCAGGWGCGGGVCALEGGRRRRGLPISCRCDAAALLKALLLCLDEGAEILISS